MEPIKYWLRDRQNLVNQSYRYAKKNNLNFIPLVFDALNPSTNSGWEENERLGF